MPTDLQAEISLSLEEELQHSISWQCKGLGSLLPSDYLGLFRRGGVVKIGKLHDKELCLKCRFCRLWFQEVNCSITSESNLCHMMSVLNLLQCTLQLRQCAFQSPPAFEHPTGSLRDSMTSPSCSSYQMSRKCTGDTPVQYLSNHQISLLGAFLDWKKMSEHIIPFQQSSLFWALHQRGPCTQVSASSLIEIGHIPAWILVRLSLQPYSIYSFGAFDNPWLNYKQHLSEASICKGFHRRSKWRIFSACWVFFWLYPEQKVCCFTRVIYAKATPKNRFNSEVQAWHCVPARSSKDMQYIFFMTFFRYIPGRAGCGG